MVPPRFRIGDWWADRQANELWRADETVRIRAQEAALSTRSCLETYPLTSRRHKEMLLELLAKVGL